MSPKHVDGKNDWPIWRLAAQVGICAACRLVLNTARRFFYPFAPVISRGMGVPLTAVTSIIAVSQATGIFGVFFGPVADRFGYRAMMIFGLALLVIGMFSCGILPFYGVMTVSVFLAGLGKTAFDPAIQAYIGERVPFVRRGLFIGLVEFSWAGSTLVGIPLTALLIDQFGWRSPFFAMGGFGVLGMIAVALIISDSDSSPIHRHYSGGLLNTWRHVVRHRAAMGVVGFSFFVCMANDNLFVVYGAWLETSFHLSILALGFGTSVIGIAELLGESLTAGFGDRLGLKRSVFLGQFFTTAAYLMLPFWGASLVPALGALFATFLAFEFTIVTSMSLSTELLPESRATMMSGFFAAAGLGRVVGALIGGYVWLWGGILATGLVSGALNGLGLACFFWGLRDWKNKS